MFFHRKKKYADSKYSGLAPFHQGLLVRGGAGDGSNTCRIAEMPAPVPLCLQAWGDGPSGVLLAVEQHWGHFQPLSPNLEYVTPLPRVRVTGQRGGLTPGVRCGVAEVGVGLCVYTWSTVPGTGLL